MTEQWKPVAGWERFYEVSSIGQVRCLERTSIIANRWGGFTTRTYPARIMAQTLFNGRYFQVTLSHDGRRVTEYVHRLVCGAFNNPPEEGQTDVAHWDGNGMNNHASNLRWATPLENSQDTIRHGRTGRGDKHPLSILTFEVVKDIRDNGTHATDSEIAERFGVAKSTVQNVRLGHKWKWMGDV